MRQLTLEQALKEDKVIFKVTQEQATKAASILSSDGFKYAAVIVCNSPYSGRPAYWQSEEDFEAHIKSDYESYEEVAIVATDIELWQEEIVFQTQQDIWAYLSATEEHKVIHIAEHCVVGFKDGKLHDYKSIDDIWVFADPSFWKPYIESVKKEWGEQVPEGKPVLCWYGDNLFEDGKPINIGLISRAAGKFRTGLTGGGSEWEFAIPVTPNEVKQYLLENILDETSN